MGEREARTPSIAGALDRLPDPHAGARRPLPDLLDFSATTSSTSSRFIPATFREKPREPFDPPYMQKLFDIGYAEGWGARRGTRSRPARPGVAAGTFGEPTLAEGECWSAVRVEPGSTGCLNRTEIEGRAARPGRARQAAAPGPHDRLRQNTIVNCSRPRHSSTLFAFGPLSSSAKWRLDAAEVELELHVVLVPEVAEHERGTRGRRCWSERSRARSPSCRPSRLRRSAGRTRTAGARSCSRAAPSSRCDVDVVVRVRLRVVPVVELGRREEARARPSATSAPTPQSSKLSSVGAAVVVLVVVAVHAERPTGTCSRSGHGRRSLSE